MTWLGIDWLGVLTVAGVVALGVAGHRRRWFAGREPLFPEFDAWRADQGSEPSLLDALAEIRALPETAERWIA